ncbi:MAG: exosome complex protein Rrp42 [Nanoarchaeota archaeon]
MKVPKIQEQRILDYLEKGKRFDGRNTDAYRDIVIKKGISNKAEGSASVKLGNTEVYAGIKLEVIEPYPDSSDEGALITTFELSPIASPDFELGPPGIESIELGRIIDRGIRESGFIDFKKLCIKEGEKVWSVSLDIYAINDSGNLLDVAGLAALVALLDAKFPEYNEAEDKIEHNLTNKKLPLDKESMAVNITIFKIGNQFVLDPVKDEEEISEYRISFAVSSNKGEPRISAIQKGKEAAISEEDMEKILNLLEHKWKEIFAKISKHA